MRLSERDSRISVNDQTATLSAAGKVRDGTLASDGSVLANSIPDDLLYLFDDGYVPWAPLPSLIPRPTVAWTTSTIAISGDYTLNTDDAIRAASVEHAVFRSSNPNDLTIDGTIWCDNKTTFLARFSKWEAVTINGDVVVLSRNSDLQGVYFDQQASPFYAGYDTLFANNGNLTVISAYGSATGVYSALYWGDSLRYPEVVHSNTGTIEVWAGDAAKGVHFNKGGQFDNSGTIRAVGDTEATGYFTRHYGTFLPNELTNSGFIEAVAGSGTSFGVRTFASGDFNFTNSGTVRADYAVFSGYEPHERYTITVNNTETGELNGHLYLSGTIDRVTNDGLITGDVLLHHHDDVFRQLSGYTQGIIDLGAGDDIAQTDLGDDTVYGGFGADRIRTGAGNDILIGGQGADYLDGASGIDVADYSDSLIAVSVDLETGTGSGGDASGDTLIRIENLTGSAFDDALTGDLKNNILTGGDGNDRLQGNAGNDTLNGGAGIDTAVYAGNRDDYDVTDHGDGSFTVVDLRTDSPEGTDTLTGIERIEFADMAIGETEPAPIGAVPIEGFLFPGGEGMWASLPSTITERPDVASAETLLRMFDDFHIQGGEFYLLSNTMPIFFLLGNQPDIINEGTIWLENNDSYSTAIFGGRGLGLVSNYGNIVAISSGGSATAVAADASGRLHNAGNMLAISTTGTAMGFWTYEGTRENNPLINSGTIETWAGGNAIGMELHNGGNLSNSGTVRATGQENAAGVLIGNGHFTLDNSGLLQATAQNQASYAIYDEWTGDITVSNTGIIRGDFALYAYYHEAYGWNPVSVDNQAGGLIEGDFLLVNSLDTITNSGAIVGDLLLGEYDDSFTQLDGTLDGILDLGEGNDTALMNFGADTVLGGAGNDTISTGLDDDLLDGGAGNDRLDGGAGRDMAVFTGNVADYSIDVASAGGFLVTDLRNGSPDGADVLANIETLQFADGVISLTVGSADGEAFVGGAGAEMIDAGAGHDYMRGEGGDDLLSGGAGNDIVKGGTGEDRLSGGDGDDRLDGMDDNDVLDGGLGNDRIVGGGGDDWMFGGAGNDLMGGADGDDTMTGQAGNDVLYGIDGNDKIYGGGGTDFIVGGKGDDLIDGGADADRIRGGGGFDTIFGGGGDDIASGNGGDDHFTGGAGDDRFEGGNGLEDTAHFSGNYDDYEVKFYANWGMVVVTDLRDGSPDGQDRLFTTEILQFADGHVDVNGGMLDFTPSAAAGAEPGTKAPVSEAITLPDLSNIDPGLFDNLSIDPGLSMDASGWETALAEMSAEEFRVLLGDFADAVRPTTPLASQPSGLQNPDMPDDATALPFDDVTVPISGPTFLSVDSLEAW